MTKAIKHVLLSLGLIYVIGFIITLITECFLDVFVFDISGIFIIMIMMFIYKIMPFIPFLVCIYILSNLLVNKKKINFAFLIIVVVCLFLIYGRLVWRGEFFSLHRLINAGYTFSQWWTAETINWHFSTASLIATIYFVWMTFYRKDKRRRKSSGLNENDPINT